MQKREKEKKIGIKKLEKNFKNNFKKIIFSFNAFTDLTRDA